MVDQPTSEDLPFRVTPVVVHALLSVADSPAHAYGIMKEIADRTRGSVRVGPGSLHFTLVKLHKAGMIDTVESPGADNEDARRKYYRITERGREILQAELAIMAGTIEVARSRNLLVDGGPA